MPASSPSPSRAKTGRHSWRCTGSVHSGWPAARLALIHARPSGRVRGSACSGSRRFMNDLHMLLARKAQLTERVRRTVGHSLRGSPRARAANRVVVERTRGVALEEPLIQPLRHYSGRRPAHRHRAFRRDRGQSRVSQRASARLLARAQAARTLTEDNAVSAGSANKAIPTCACFTCTGRARRSIPLADAIALGNA